MAEDWICCAGSLITKSLVEILSVLLWLLSTQQFVWQTKDPVNHKALEEVRPT